MLSTEQRNLSPSVAVDPNCCGEELENVPLSPNSSDDSPMASGVSSSVSELSQCRRLQDGGGDGVSLAIQQVKDTSTIDTDGKIWQEVIPFLFICGSVLAIDIMIVGMMATRFIDISLNVLSEILLLLSIGFSVDYSIHVVEAFKRTCGKTKRDRLVETLLLIGKPLTHAAVSTFLSLLPVIGRNEYIMQVFFKMTSLVVFFALLVGAVFLPCVLALFGPRSPASSFVIKVTSATNYKDVGGLAAKLPTRSLLP